jgi:hypothetical protein
MAVASEVSVYTTGLIEGDTIWACTTGCQDRATHSDPRGVESDQGIALRADIVTPVYPIDTTITVNNLVTGARVITRVIGQNHPSGQKILTSYAWAPSIPVYTGQLFVDDEITVFQGLCHASAAENQSATIAVKLGDLAVSIAPNSVELGTTRNVLVTATDPQRSNMPVVGDVSIGGIMLGKTNATLSWRAPATGASAPVQINAPGYQSWTGSIALTTPLPPNPPTQTGGAQGGGPPSPSTKQASYNFACKPVTGGVEFTVTGEGFPTVAGTVVTIEPDFDGLFYAFQAWHNCGEGILPIQKQVQPDAQGKFSTTVTVLYGCQQGCSVGLTVRCNKLMSSQITGPKIYCSCS